LFQFCLPRELVNLPLGSSKRRILYETAGNLETTMFTVFLLALSFFILHKSALLLKIVAELAIIYSSDSVWRWLWYPNLTYFDMQCCYYWNSQ